MSAHDTKQPAQIDALLDSIGNAKNVLAAHMIADCAPDPILHPLKRLRYELSASYRTECERPTREYLQFMEEMARMMYK